MSAAGYDNLQLRGEYGTEPYWPEKKLKICVTGAGGFIASHLAKRLKEEGHHVVGCDWKRNEHMPVRHRARERATRARRENPIPPARSAGAPSPRAPRARFG
jgi:NAD(P)-dependent dehydrogenase (short-subunit alcohol dehydrogenase family)